MTASSASLAPSQRPLVELHSQEARREMLRVVRGLFPNGDEWPERMLEILRSATIEERNRFVGDEGGMDYEVIYWVCQEAEMADPAQAARWQRFRSPSPSLLRIRPPRVMEMPGAPLGVVGEQFTAPLVKARDPGRHRQARGRRAEKGLPRSLEPPTWPGDRGLVPPHLNRGRK